MTLLARFGLITYFQRLPWLGGMILGVGISVGFTLVRLLARRLRVAVVASRVAALVALTAFFGAASVGGRPNPVAAQSTLPPCEVEVDGPGVNGPTAVARSTADNPIVVDTAVADVVNLRWVVADETALTGNQWWVRTEIAGYSRDLMRAEGEERVTDYQVALGDASLPPGTYRVWGGFDNVCAEQVGYVRIIGSPLTDATGLAVAGGALAGAGGLLVLALMTRFDYWSFTTDDGITVDIVDTASGQIVRRPLVRGGTYIAIVSFDLPDPVPAYADIQGPIEVVVGALGALATPAMATMDLRQTLTGSRRQTVEVPFQVPTIDGGSLELNIDLAVGGNVVQTLRMSGLERGVSRFAIERGVGSVLYRAGDLSARHLCGCVPVDTSVIMHGDDSRRSIEAWSLAGTEGLRVIGRQRIPVEDLETAARDYRSQLESALDDWTGAADPDGLDTIKALAWSGYRVRQLLLGDGPKAAPADGTILITQDERTTSSMTFPWTGLYERAVDTDKIQRVCKSVVNGGSEVPESCHRHSEQTVCPYDFWGMRYELMWPPGWAPNKARSSSKRRWSLARPGPVPNRLSNRLPVDFLAVVDEDFRYTDKLNSVLIDRPVNCHRAHTFGQLRHAMSGSGAQCSVIYFLAHGSTISPVRHGWETSIQRSGYSLAFDQPLDGAELRRLAGPSRFGRGPLAIVNACQSGVIGLDGHHGFIDGLWNLGARAVVVTETRVTEDQAADAGNRIVQHFLDGNRVGQALLLARREDYAETGRLTMLAYAYYGPAGLRLTQPALSRPMPARSTPASCGRRTSPTS